jgi:branched-chain amino acid transport system substrate-binding protein
VLGGRPLNLVVADDSGLPEKAAAAMLKLILDDKVVAVFGATQSSVMKAEQPVAEQYSVAQFSTAASSPTITAAHYNTTFRTHAMDSDKIQMFLEWVNAAGKHKIAGLFENTDSGISQLTWMRDNLTAFAPNAELRSFTYELTVVDFTALLLQIKDYGADALWLGGTGAQNILIMKQALDVGLYPSTPTTGAADWAVRSDYWDALGQNGTGICFVAFYSPNQKRTQLGDDGFNLYLRDYGTPPVYEAINAFGQANIIAQAINQANSTDSALIVQALRTGTFTHWNSDNVTFPEIGGPYWHQWAPPMMILQITSFRQPYTQMPIIAPAALKTADFKPPPY